MAHRDRRVGFDPCLVLRQLRTLTAGRRLPLATRMTHLRYGRLQTFAAQKHSYSTSTQEDHIASHIRRRELIVALGGAGAASARAQQGGGAGSSSGRRGMPQIASNVDTEQRLHAALARLAIRRRRV
jgi:hypothetical protein